MSRSTMDRVRGLELFSGCRRAQVRAIDRLGCTLDVQSGRTLCRAGTRGDAFFVLVAGSAIVQASSGAVGVLHAGAWFGEIALLRGGPRRADVTTRGRTTVLVYTRRELTELCTIAPHVRARLEATVDHTISVARPTLLEWYQVVAPSHLTAVGA